MADPLCVIASLLAVATAGVQSTRALKEAAQRYKTRDSILRRLLDEIGDAENILFALKQLLQADTLQPAVEADISMAALLRRPIERCSEVCGEFEKAMEQFSKKSKTGFLDWTKMEFMRGDINQFMDTVAGYKATISVGLGLLTMRIAKLSHQALEEYDDLVKNTICDLRLRLQRIDDKVQGLKPISGPFTSNTDIDLSNERQVTEQCLRICQDAKSYLESLASKDPTLLQDVPSWSSANDLRDQFEAQLLTRQALVENQTSFVNIITRLRERLESVVLDGDASERSQLQEDIQTSRQCLEVCKLASNEVSSQKIHIIGDATADGDSDQVVVTTLADMFKVGNTTSKNRSALLVGSMSDEALMQVSNDRYNSRFGNANIINHANQGKDADTNLETPDLGSSSLHRRDKHRQPSQPPSSNETRKRRADLETNSKKTREQ